MDAALVLPWDNAISAADTGALLSLVATRVVPGGPLLSCVRTRLAGPPQPGVLESPAAAQRWLAGLGLQLHGALDLRISDAGLLAATDIRTGDARIPNLLVGDGASLVGNLFVTAVRAPIRPNASI